MRETGMVRLAWLVTALSWVVAIGAVVLLMLNGSPIVGNFNGATVVAALLIPFVGALIVGRRPRNPVGWLYVFAGITQSVGLFCGEWARYTFFTRPGSLPAGPVMSWISVWIWVSGIGVMLTFALLLFPDGQLPSPRWRPVAGAAALSIVAAGLAIAAGGWSHRGPDVLVNEPEGVLGLIGFAGLVVLFVVAIASVISLWVRLRRAEGDQRQQVKWLLYGGTVFVLGLIADSITLGDSSIISVVVAPAIPLAAAIAILKYRLYDIEVVIGKTVVLGVLVAFITLTYVGVVAGVGTLAGRKGSAALSAIAAALVAVAFQPARTWARRLANRLVYGKRATPYEALSALSARMAGTVSVEDVVPRVAAILGEATGATRSDVWLRVGRELRPAAVGPDRGPPPVPILLLGEDLPESLGFDRSVAVRHRGELLGAMSVTKGPGDPISPAEEKLLEDLASQAGLVLRNARLIEELRASRQRLVAAQDEERRRIERNLHDGAQQQLVALSVKQRLAEGLIDREPEKVRRLLAEIQSDTTDALDNLRDLARGIYPPLLAAEGLAAALEAQVRRAPIPVELDADSVGRYPPEIEAAVYFCCLEALQNVSKYANATGATLLLSTEQGGLSFQVSDDGSGFDPGSTASGTGLQGMADRLDAIGGTLEVLSRPGEGTTVVGRIPAGRGGDG